MIHRNYPIGTTVLRRTGYAYVKTTDGWESKHRLVAKQKLGRDLEEGEKVYHINGDREDNSPGNLVPIKFNSTRYVFRYKKAHVLYMPGHEKVRAA